MELSIVVLSVLLVFSAIEEAVSLPHAATKVVVSPDAMDIANGKIPMLKHQGNVNVPDQIQFELSGQIVLTRKSDSSPSVRRSMKNIRPSKKLPGYNSILLRDEVKKEPLAAHTFSGKRDQLDDRHSDSVRHSDEVKTTKKQQETVASSEQKSNNGLFKFPGVLRTREVIDNSNYLDENRAARTSHINYN